MDQVPHLSEEAKRDLWAETPPYLRDARIKGIPVFGAGLIYPIPDDDIKVAASSIQLADNWPRCFAMDVSFNKTAVAWFAKNPISQVVYLYDCHYQGREEPALHAEAIKARGAWIPGVIDPRADNRSADDSKHLFKMYTEHYKLNLFKAEASVTSGITEVWQMLVSGMLKISDAPAMAPFWKEFRMYRTKQNKDGDISVVKQDDHLCDCLRYFVVSGIQRMRTANGASNARSRYLEVFLGPSTSRRGLSWMGG